MKYKFTCENKDSRDIMQTLITYETETNFLGGPDVMGLINDFELFLKGCGFLFKGNLQIVESEDDKEES